MRKVLMTLVLVAGCGAGGDGDSNSSASNRDASSSVAAAGLTGLYEGGPAERPNQLCVVDRGKGKAAFGLVTWGASLNSCSGAGDIKQDGNRLTLAMTGDQTCTIDATLDKGVITLSGSLPAGCSYYCGAQAQLGGASFARKGATVADAMKAKDLVGEPLCEGLDAR